MRLMFSTLNCVLDRSSGAALSVQTLLEALADAGVDCASFTSSVFDTATPIEPLAALRATGAAPVDPADTTSHWLHNLSGVVHWLQPASTTARRMLTHEEELGLLRRAVRAMEEFQPDALLVYGAGFFERGLLKIAHDRGIATLFYLANPTYQDEAVFQHVDQVLTDTEATRSLYAERLHLEAQVIGKFVRLPVVPRPPAPAEYVTFVNPAPEKGVTLFYRILELANDTGLEVPFLVVESRATLADAERLTGLRFDRFPNLERVGLQSDMGPVYARTKVLLLPSLWHESGARTLVEACGLGIPVIASNRGGSSELLGEAGFLIEPPAPLVENYLLVPPVSEAIVWVEAIRQLTTDAKVYAAACEAMRAQWPRHKPAARASEVAALLGRVVSEV